MLSVRRAIGDGLPVAAVAVACCAGLPVIATLLGGLALGAVLGIAGGVLVAAALLAGAVLVFRRRRRRSSGVAR